MYKEPIAPNLRLACSETLPVRTLPKGDLQPAGAGIDRNRSNKRILHLVRDLVWFRAREAEIGTPQNEVDRRLLERYRALISQRRIRLLGMRRELALGA